MKRLMLAVMFVLVGLGNAFAQVPYPYEDGTWASGDGIKNGNYWPFRNYTTSPQNKLGKPAGQTQHTEPHEIWLSFVDPTDSVDDPQTWATGAKDYFGYDCAAKPVPAGLIAGVQDYMNRVNTQTVFDITFTEVLEEPRWTEGLSPNVLYDFVGEIRIMGVWGGNCVVGFAQTVPDTDSGGLTSVVITFDVLEYTTGGTACRDTFDPTNSWCTVTKNGTNLFYNPFDGGSYIGGLHSGYVVAHEFGHALGLKHPDELNDGELACSDQDALHCKYDQYTTNNTGLTIMSATTARATANSSGDRNSTFHNTEVSWHTGEGASRNYPFDSIGGQDCYGRCKEPWRPLSGYDRFILWPEPLTYSILDGEALSFMYGSR